MNKAIFLDRDGTVNAPILEKDITRSPRMFSEFAILPGVKDAVREMRSRGYLVFIATNQPEVVRGLVKKEEVEKMHALLKQELELAGIQACFHDNAHNCECRKPKSGMLLDAAKKFDIDLKASFMVGDTWRDVEAGKAAGCTTILVDAPYNKEVEADHRVSSLMEILPLIRS